ncbi:MAG: DUF86 domain-containing protein [Halofilum sp. (in: g-proteobacteria)]
MASVVEEKLETLRRCVRRVEDKRAASAEELRKDADRQDIVALNLTRAVQICVDLAMHLIAETDEPLPQTMGDAFDSLARLGLIDEELRMRMRAAVGFRNVAVHAYQQIDWNIVQAITWQHLDDFKRFARGIAAATKPSR